MSKLYINDLEKIAKGKIERFNFLENKKIDSLISLRIIDNRLSELRRIRSYIIELFKEDMEKRVKGDKINSRESIILNPERLFLNEYLSLIIPTALGDNHCLFSKDTLVASDSMMSELENKAELILPYIKRIYEVAENTNLLDNEFYDNINIYNDNYDNVLNLNGNGVVLPFNDYNDLDDIEKQELLKYYYSNLQAILKNILVPNTEVLDRFKENITKEKALELYKGSK